MTRLFIVPIMVGLLATMADRPTVGLLATILMAPLYPHRLEWEDRQVVPQIEGIGVISRKIPAAAGGSVGYRMNARACATCATQSATVQRDFI
jgi:hypothetical protein